MKKYLSYLAISLSFLLVLVAACKPSVKGQTSTFERNTSLLNSYTGDFPGLAPHLTATSNEFTEKWKATEAIKEEEKKAEEMKKVNAALKDDKLFDALQKYDSRKSGLESFVKKYAGKSIKYKNRSTFDSLNNHITESENLLSYVPRNLRGTTAASKADAITALLSAYESLNKQHLSNMQIERRLKDEQKKPKN